MSYLTNRFKSAISLLWIEGKCILNGGGKKDGDALSGGGKEEVIVCR